MISSTGTWTDKDPTQEAFDEELAEAVEQGPEDVSKLLETWSARHPERAEAFRNQVRVILMFMSLCEPERLGPYHLLDVLTVGGMGKIYQAKEDETGRIVVVKTVREGELSPEDHVRRFDTERKLLSRLHHTHIVPLLFTGREGNLRYMAMPFIPGVTMKSLISSASGESIGHSFPTFEALYAEASRIESTRRSEATLSMGKPRIREQADPPGNAPASSRDRNQHRLPADYPRRVVAMMVDVAQAVQHIHDAALLHRDLKPSNIMIESTDHCWVIDIGLGRELGEGGDVEGDGSTDPAGPFDEMTRGAGTLAYMAPEQLRALTDDSEPRAPVRQDARTDVWGLGVTLYESLSLRLPFPGATPIEIARKILNESPAPLNGQVPAELKAICMKALEKAPGDRYASAAAFAADLRCWLATRPTAAGEAAIRRKSLPLLASPRVWLRRFGFWSRRRRAAAFAAGLLTALVLGGILGAAHIAAVRLEAARRELDRVALRDLRSPIRKRGWSEEHRMKVRSLSTGDRAFDLEQLQPEAVAGLGNLDAKIRKSFDYEASILAFEAGSQRLLMLHQDPKARTTRTRLWDGETDQVIADVDLGLGVLAFRADGTPVQLGMNRQDPGRLDLYDVSGGKVIQQFHSPVKGESECRAITITPYATHVAAVIWPAGPEKPRGIMVADKEEPCTIAVWETATGKLVSSWGHKAGPDLDLLLSPDARLLAAWEPTRPVHLWKVHDGHEVGTYRTGRAYISSVAFGRDPVWRVGPEAAMPPWLLAVGDWGGLITIWDLRAGAVRSHCRGSLYNVTSLAFSPDGSLLLSAGRSPAKVWDVASGTCVLDLPVGNLYHAATFSSDGQRIAVGWGPEFSPQEGAAVLELEYGHGLRPLFGLEGAIEKAVFSPDGRSVAANSHNWEVGIWEWPSGRLRCLLPAPVGLWADSVGLAFDTRNDWFACAAGHQVRLWDLKTEHLIDEWTVPEGLCNALAFTADGSRLLLMRLETRDKRLPPDGGANPGQHPRVCRLYDLRVKATATPIQEITAFDWHVLDIAVNADGTFFAIDGVTSASGRLERILHLYGGAPAKLVGSLPVQLPPGSGARPLFDPTGTFLMVGLTSDSRELFSVPGLQLRDRFPRYLLALGPGGQRWLQLGSSPAPGMPRPLLFGLKGSESPLLRIPAEALASSNSYRFSADGKNLVLGHADGQVTVCDLVEVNKRLSALGLGW